MPPRISNPARENPKENPPQPEKTSSTVNLCRVVPGILDQCLILSRRCSKRAEPTADTNQLSVSYQNHTCLGTEKGMKNGFYERGCQEKTLPRRRGQLD